MGKHTLDLLDGYRPNSLARLSYGSSQLLELALSRNEGMVYISESRFGALPPSTSEAPNSNLTKWSLRAGWQQIAD